VNLIKVNLKQILIKFTFFMKNGLFGSFWGDLNDLL